MWKIGVVRLRLLRSDVFFLMKNAGTKNVTGDRIRQCRRSIDPPLTQAELARRMRKMGVPMLQDALSRIENRRMGVSDIELIALAKCLGITVAFLCGEQAAEK